jgi:GPH family glycoside/pentoside/hexuronide:cation symporter
VTLAQRIAYSLGNPGFNITGHIVVAIGIYYYLPPGDVADLSPQLGSAIYLGAFTAYGLARLIGGIVDSLADPFVGHWSDRSRSRLGRRRSFMIYGIVPMAVTPALLFWPPGEPGSSANFIALTILLAVYFVFFTTYVGPYLALMPEIARGQAERVALSRLFAVVGFPILVFLGPAWQLAVGVARDAGVSSEDAIRAIVVLLSLLAFVLCLAPILAVDERKLPRAVPADLSLREAVSLTVRNRPFLIYLSAQVLFILGVTMLQPLTPYLAEVVLGRDLGFASLLGIASVPSGVLGFVLAPRLVERLGPKGTIVASVTLMGLVLGSLALLEPDTPGGPHDAHNLIVVFTTMIVLGLAISAFLILPNVVIAQLIDCDEIHTGANRSAMFYGAQGLFTKWAYAASATIMSFLFTRYGNSQEEPLGILLVGPLAGALCIVSAGLYALYPERQVLAAARRERR